MFDVFQFCLAGPMREQINIDDMDEMDVRYGRDEMDHPLPVSVSLRVRLVLMAFSHACLS